MREVRTSDEMRAAIGAGDVPVLVGGGSFDLTTTGTESPQIVVKDGYLRVEARESSQPSVEAWGSSQPRVEAWGSSQPSVVAWGSSQPSVEAWGSSQPRVEARESSQPSVEAWGSSQPSVVAWGSSQPRVVAWGSSQPSVEAWESSQPRVEAKGFCQLAVGGPVKVIAAATVAILITFGKPSVEGGGFVQRVERGTPETWSSYFGLDTANGHVLLFKAVKQDFYSPKGISYAPGTAPEAPDWDGGKMECGGGLHFSPSPRQALEFYGMATGERANARFIACPVALAEMAVHPDGQYPDKCKARRLSAPGWEVDIDGNPLPGAVVSWPPPAVVAVAKSKPARKKVTRGRKAAKR